MIEPTEIVRRVTRAMHCSECGVEAAAACDCGAPYIPAGAAAAKAVAAHPEKSDRAIAAVIGVSDKTVAKARKATAENSAAEPRIGLDGIARKQPAKKIATKKPPKVQPGMDPARDIINEALDLVARMDGGQRAEFFDLLVEKYGADGVPLNAVGKPFSPSYDPKYKRRTPLTSINRLRVNPPKIRDAPPPDIGSEHVRDFCALDDADEHVIDYYSVMEEAISNSPAPEVAEMMKVAVDHGADPGPFPENLRRTA
jgi:hypothetical protein